MKNGIEHFKRYNSLFVLSATVCLFLGLKQIKIQNNKIVNGLASTTLAVYIMHDSGYLRNIIWQEVLKAPAFQYSKWLLVHAIGSCIIVFLFFAVVDLSRQRIIEKPCMTYLAPFIEKIVYSVDNKIGRLSDKLK